MPESKTFELSADKGRIVVKIVVDEVVDEQNGTSNIVVKSFEAKSSKWYGITYYLDGVISINNFDLISFSRNYEQYYCYWDLLNKFGEIRVQKGGRMPPWKSAPLNSSNAILSINIKGYTSSGKYDSGWTVQGTFEIPLSHGTPVVEDTGGFTTSFKFDDKTVMAFFNKRLVVMTVKKGVIAEDNAVIGYAVLGNMILGKGG
jgi:hypothetical protein